MTSGFVRYVLPPARTALVAALLALSPLTATGGTAVTTDIGLTCTALPDVSDALSQTICTEFRLALQTRYPVADFQRSTTAPPRIDLTIHRADDRSLRLSLDWTGADGQLRRGEPMHVAFFDKKPDEAMRRRFYETFLGQNALPL